MSVVSPKVQAQQRIIDLRLVLDRDGHTRLYVEGKECDCTGGASEALSRLVRIIEARSWAQECSTFEALARLVEP